MIRLCFIALALLVPILATGAGNDKDRARMTGDATYSNDTVDIAATVLLAREDITDTLGADPGPGYCIVKITVTPKDGQKLRVDADDFTILSHKDGQRSQPFQPSQIAGSATMVVSTRSTGGGGLMGESNGPIWGGIGGAPERLPGNGGGFGNAGGGETTSARVEKSTSNAKSPLLVALEKHMFPVKDTTEPVSGLLYFPLDGKQKAKDLALLYKGQAGRFSMEFHQSGK